MSNISRAGGAERIWTRGLGGKGNGELIVFGAFSGHTLAALCGRAVRRSENPGVPVVIRWAQSVPPG